MKPDIFKTEAAGVSLDSPRTPRAHFRPSASNTTNERTPRERQKERNGGGKGKKKREILSLPPFRAPPFGSSFFWDSGPNPFLCCPTLTTPCCKLCWRMLGTRSRLSLDNCTDDHQHIYGSMRWERFMRLGDISFHFGTARCSSRRERQVARWREALRRSERHLRDLFTTSSLGSAPSGFTTGRPNSGTGVGLSPPGFKSSPLLRVWRNPTQWCGRVILSCHCPRMGCVSWELRSATLSTLWISWIRSLWITSCCFRESLEWRTSKQRGCCCCSVEQLAPICCA